MAREDIHKQVYVLVRQIPAGKVATYGDIARVVGINPRYVGYVLHHNPSPGDIPCHRVVNAQGKAATAFAFGGGAAQQKLLEDEGILFVDDRLNLAIYRHRF